MAPTSKQRKELKEFQPEIKLIGRDLGHIERTGRVPSGGLLRYKAYEKEGYVSFNDKTWASSLTFKGKVMMRAAKKHGRKR